jgi:hypothetical protein
MSSLKIIRNYTDYTRYIEHQKEKTLDPDRRTKWLNKEWEQKVLMFTSLFERHADIISTCKKAICLCARTGQEVISLQKMGIDAIGVDLVPYGSLVVEGDIHNLAFNDGEFDLAFCNSFDHSLYPKKMLFEMQRVLSRGGYGILHLQLMENVDEYAENIVTDASQVIKFLNSSQVILSESLKGVPFATYHWEVIFKKC